jgi:hypothetical protein
MDAVSTLLDALKKSGKTEGNLQGFLHVMIGRMITRTKDQTVVSRGMGWRDLATWLKKLRWDPEAVKELGLDPHDLPPRDRQRFWYTAIAHAKVDSAAAIAAGEKFAAVLRMLGYEVGPAPHAT